MTYWELETEAWELYPDDHYDGAQQMVHRGRMQTLERVYSLESIEKDNTP